VSLNLIDKLKACFRKELKKGGFTIEKVCLYQAVSKTFKSIADIESYITKTVNQKKCLKYSISNPDNCLKWGYAPRLGLTCPTAEIIHNGLLTNEAKACYYRYEDIKDQHANQDIILRNHDLAKISEHFWRAKFETTVGTTLLADYALLMSRATITECAALKLITNSSE